MDAGIFLTLGLILPMHILGDLALYLLFSSIMNHVVWLSLPDLSNCRLQQLLEKKIRGGRIIRPPPLAG
jgi:hypothetical protein